MNDHKFWDVIQSCNWEQRKDQSDIVSILSEELWKIPSTDLLSFRATLDLKVNHLKGLLLDRFEDTYTLLGFCYDAVAQGSNHFNKLIDNEALVISIDNYTEGFSYAIPEKYEIQEQLHSY